MATMKQKKALVKYIENHGNASKAMIDAGYDPTTAVNPSNLTKSKGWNELLEEYLPDELLTKVHLEGLQATKVIAANITYGDANEKTNDFIDVPDHPTRHKYLDTAYKVKKKIDSDPNGTNIKMVFILDA